MATVVLTAAARRDLRDIRRFIARDSESVAARMITSLMRAIGRLESFPESGRVVPEYGDESLRELIVAPFRVVYRVSATRVRILMVVHGARRLDSDELSIRL